MSAASIQAVELHWVSTRGTVRLRLRNASLFGLAMYRIQPVELFDLWLAVRNPGGRTAEASAQRIGCCEVSLLNCESEELELRFEMHNRVMSAPSNFQRIVPKPRGVSRVATKRLDFSQKHSRASPNGIGAEFCREPVGST